MKRSPWPVSLGWIVMQHTGAAAPAGMILMGATRTARHKVWLFGMLAISLLSDAAPTSAATIQLYTDLKVTVPGVFDAINLKTANTGDVTTNSNRSVQNIL